MSAKREREDETILGEADRLVNGPRQEAYGRPLLSFRRTAQIWSAILDKEVTPQQVALCMVGLKLLREANNPSRDSRVDGAGYFAVTDLIMQDLAEEQRVSDDH